MEAMYDLFMVKNNGIKKTLRKDSMTASTLDEFYIVFKINGLEYRVDLYAETNVGEKSKEKALEIFNVTVNESEILTRLIKFFEDIKTTPLSKHFDKINIYSTITSASLDRPVIITVYFNKLGDYEDQYIELTEEQVDDLINTLKCFDGIIRAKAYE